MIQVLVKKELIAQIRKAGNADGLWREDVRLLRDKVLRAVVLTNGKAGDICPNRRKRICRRPGAEHVTEIQRIRAGEIMIHAQAELVVVLAQSLRGSKSISSNVWKREKRQDFR